MENKLFEEGIRTEKERVREIVIKKIDNVIKQRNEKVKSVPRRNISAFDKLKKEILFLIDNPNYIRKLNKIN